MDQFGLGTKKEVVMKKGMNLTEIRHHKHNLEQELFASIKKFSTETGLKVVEVSMKNDNQYWPEWVGVRLENLLGNGVNHHQER